MSSSQDASVNVQHLMETIRAAVRLRRSQLPAVEAATPRVSSSDIAAVESFLALAEARTAIRTRVPRWLDRFPLTRFRMVERLLLKCYEWLTYEQRLAVAHLCQAMRESLELYRKLEASYAASVATVQAAQDQIRTAVAADGTIAERVASLERDLGVGSAPSLDALHLDLEMHFRGRRELMKQHLGVYLPIVREAIADADTQPILDVGCRRGEWLEILKEHSLPASGIDANPYMIAECRRRGFEVIETEPLRYLKNLPSGSVGAITAFHLIGRLPFARLVALLDQILRVLRPGGLAILESPNPATLIQSGCNFSLLPHGNPLPPEVAAFVLTARGFCNVRVVGLHAPTEPDLSEDSCALARRLYDCLLGPQNYGVIGMRPAQGHANENSHL